MAQFDELPLKPTLKLADLFLCGPNIFFTIGLATHGCAVPSPPTRPKVATVPTVETYKYTELTTW